ncbi:hypothetical protein FACS189451_05580 [Bacteroidia bacterium]|nr:hypothetical protein FACS189446_1400 [Bacteroidia bacterium]GHT62083.1 hypothetical protein FACS189451_05580 [Bacteroidia bacterium]
MKRFSIVIMLSVISIVMTTLSISDKFLSTSFLIKIGIAILLAVSAILIAIMGIKPKNQKK